MVVRYLSRLLSVEHSCFVTGSVAGHFARQLRVWGNGIGVFVNMGHVGTKCVMVATRCGAKADARTIYELICLSVMGLRIRIGVSHQRPLPHMSVGGN
jgi:hypothetical protein